MSKYVSMDAMLNYIGTGDILHLNDTVEIVRCKDCKYFEYDHVEDVEGYPIPLILAHEICTTIEKGLCACCFKRVPIEGGKTCSVCRGRQTYYRQNAIKAAHAMNRCTHCRKGVPLYGKQLCAACDAARLAQHKKDFARRKEERGIDIHVGDLIEAVHYVEDHAADYELHGVKLKHAADGWHICKIMTTAEWGN